jgi:hypothetical protein
LIPSCFTSKLYLQMQMVEDAEKSGLVQDDSEQLERITDQLAAVPQHMVAETELKRYLGFSGVRGHRTWRKLRDKLVAGGFVAEVSTKVEVRVVAHVWQLRSV